MSAQLEIERQHTSAGRVFRILLSDNAAAPVESSNPNLRTTADLVSSAVRADGLTPTTGLMFMLKAPTAPAGAPAAVPSVVAGFDVVVWVRNPVNGQWGATQQVSVPYNTWFRTFDFNGGELYWQITGAVNAARFVDLHLVEL